ncbi:MAG: hypothetical protein JXX28_12100 [Deltaproteobacteria bacterium]|nr:hypothetical protein [Deltaproteobacteria bacterium]
MSDALQSILQRVDSIHDRYRGHFAGQSRATRDLGLLSQLTDELQPLRAQASALSGVLPGGEGIVGRIDEYLALYQSEQQAISKLQAAGPDATDAATLVDWDQVDHQRYARHFAGQSRLTRDHGLMIELSDQSRGRIAAFKGILGRQGEDFMPGVLDTLVARQKMYDKEREEIPHAIASVSPADRARYLATAANGQFQLYRDHFEGKARNTRRLPLIQRMTQQLRVILREMETLRDRHGVNTESHRSNIEKVSARITHHQNEMVQIQAAVGQTSLGDRISGLANEANALFQTYREGYAGKARAQADLSQLGLLCDQLHEIGLTMVELHEQLSNPTLAKNTAIVLENLKRYEREYEAIKATRTAQA